jgi:hypothetical protein
MTLWIAIGAVVLFLLLGGAGMRVAGRKARGMWRPGAAMLSVVAMMMAATFAVRQQFLAAFVIFLVGLFLSMTARRTGPVRPRAGAAPPPQPKGMMSREEASSILGVGPGATPQEVQAAYLRLIRLGHPDQGGTSGLAAQLNAARDVLLGKK